MFRKKVKAYNHSRIYLNPEKILTKRLIEWGYDKIGIEFQVDYIKDCLGCCIFRNHEIALHLNQIKDESDYIGIDFYKLICMVLSHETMELLCNDIMNYGELWHFYAIKLRTEGYGC